MTREQCHREALCRLHNMYFVELTWCCCCVSNADAVEKQRSSSTFESVAHACFGGKAAVSDACQTVSGGTKRESTEQTEQTQQTRDGTERKNLVSRASSAPWSSWGRRMLIDGPANPNQHIETSAAAGCIRTKVQR